MWLELYVVLVQHSSEISGLCSMKCPGETLQNFGIQKYTYFIFAYEFILHLFSPNECPINIIMGKR